MIQSAQSNPQGNAPEELIELRDAAVAAQGNARKARQWDRARRLYQGDFYSDVEMPEWKATGANPKLWEVVQRLLPILTDSQPKFAMKPRGLEDELLARVLQVGVDYEWERQDMQRKIALLGKTGFIFGNAFLYTGVDPKVGGNRLYTKLRTPYEVFPDPEATSDDDLAYCFFKTNARVSDLVRNYGPKIATKVVQEGAPKAGGERPRFRDMPRRDAHPGTDSTVGDDGTLSGSDILGPMTKFGFRASSERYEVWEGDFTDFGVTEITAAADGEDSKFTVQNVGRRVILIGDTYVPELDDISVFKHEQIPISSFMIDDTPNDFWAGSYIIPLADKAEAVADLDNQILNSVHLMLGAVWLVPTQSGIKAGSIYQFPSMQIPYNAPHKPEVVGMPNMPSFVHILRNDWQRELDDASGVNDISRGNFQGSLDDVSGKAVQRLQAPTYTRVRLIERNLRRCISRWGYQTACNMVQFWTPQMWMRILPDDLKAQIIQLGTMPWDKPEYQGLPYEWLLPDVIMETGSSLPEDKQSAFSTTLNLLDRGMLGRDAMGNPGGPLAVDAVLSRAEFPNREQFVALAAQREQQQAQAMMMQQMVGQPPPGAPPGVNESGEDKALGAERSAESELAVGASPQAQEVAS